MSFALRLVLKPALPHRTTSAFLLLLVADLVVMLEQVLAKVAAEVAPHGMDVVGVVLCVV
jgi:hypothetical protein